MVNLKKYKDIVIESLKENEILLKVKENGGKTYIQIQSQKKNIQEKESEVRQNNEQLILKKIEIERKYNHEMNQ